MLLACVTGSVDEELLLRNEYLASENRILRKRIEDRVILTDAERQSLAEILRIGAMDLLIAAIAKHHELIVVTNNTAHFERLPDLALENWLRPGQESC